MHFNHLPASTSPREHVATRMILRRILSLAFLIVLCILLLHLLSHTAEGVAWRYEGRITPREYRDIALTDLGEDGKYDVGGIIKEPEGGDPSAEFHTYDSGTWSAFPEDIAYKGIYNDLAIIGPYVSAGHSGGNSVDSWYYNDGSGEFEFNEPDPASPTENYSLCIDIGDLNNDTFPDIVAGYKTNGIKVFYGDGTGQYTMGEFPKDSDMVKAIIIADLNNDTHSDIVSTHKVWGGGGNEMKKIEIWMGDGEGNWSKKTVFEDKNIDYSTLAAADLDNDSYLDIIAASDSKFGIDKYIYQPAGSFWDRGSVSSKGKYSSVLLHDINGDDEEDVIGCRFDDSGINMYIGTGTGGFESEDVGPVQNGNFWSCVVWDFNGDGHDDLVAANMNGTFYWEQSLPEIKNVMIPGTMLAQHEHYYLSLEVSSESLAEDYDNLQAVKLRFFENGTTFLTLAFDGNPDRFYVEEGTQYAILDSENCTRIDLPQGKVEISFLVKFKWAVPDLPRGEGPMVKAYMKEVRGSTGWVDVDPGNVKLISSVAPGNIEMSDGDKDGDGHEDTCVNPGDSVLFSGDVLYNGTDVPVPDGYIKRVVVHAGDNDTVTDWDIVNGTFSAEMTISSAGEFPLWPEIIMNRGGAQPDSLPYPERNLTVLSDFIVVTDMWITGELYYDSNTRISWQRAGSPITFHTHAQYNHSGLPYEGELMLTNGSVFLNTTGRNLEYTSQAMDLVEVQFYPMNDSGFDNPYGPMLVNEIGIIPKAMWDGEAPIIQDFTAMSLLHGSEIKAVDGLVEIIVTERGSFESFRSYGEIMINWSIIQDENTTINGSGLMDKAWYQENNYTFSYYLPLSQANTDNIVEFWFHGNDTLGNEYVSYLWPVRCTEEDPATVLVDPMPPEAPRGLYTNVGDGYIEVRWLPNTEDDLAGYRIYRSTDGENFSKSPISGLDLVRYHYFLDTGLENGKKYYYRVTAVDQAVIPNESNFSDIISAVPKEDESDPNEAFMDVLKDNILFVFIGIAALIIIGGSVMILRRDRYAGSAVGGSEKGETGRGPGSSSSLSSPLSPSMPTAFSSTAGAGMTTGPAGSAGHPHQVKTPVSSTPSQPAVPKKPFPPVDWVCPNCRQHITLQQDERFCTGCGYKIR